MQYHVILNVKELEFYTLNVFSEQGIYGGNQLAVVFAELSEREMQAITRQFNYSECTFVSNITNTGADVRIFLPSGEIAFAGHPTIGTAYILEHIWRQSNTPRDRLILNLKKGPIEVEIRSKDHNIDLVTMNQFIPESLGEQEDRAYVAELLGINTDDLMDLPIKLISPSKLPFMFVPVTSVKVLSRLQPNHSRMQQEFDQVKGEPYVFTVAEQEDTLIVQGRFFAPNSGITEDPATGSAQASLARYLQQTGLLHTSNFITKQGYDMRRPSVLYNTAVFEQEKLLRATTGGRTVIVSHGSLYI